MTLWTPVITSNVSSLPEVVWEKWITIDPNNIDDLSEKLYNLLINEELRKENIKYWLEKAQEFSWEKCAKETINIYEELWKK
jgi:glycosyltransferase involved in cell wall biosynthesis